MAKKPQPIPKSYEEAMTELDQIVAEVERGEVSLEESINKYERGMFLLQHCRKVLGDAEKQIEVLTRGEDGNLKTEPLPPTA